MSHPHGRRRKPFPEDAPLKLSWCNQLGDFAEEFDRRHALGDNQVCMLAPRRCLYQAAQEKYRDGGI